MIELLRLESALGALRRAENDTVEDDVVDLLYHGWRAIRISRSPEFFGPVEDEVWISLGDAARALSHGGRVSGTPPLLLMSAVQEATATAKAGLKLRKAASAATTKASAATAAISEARLKGYTGDTCGECGGFTVRRKGTCLACDCGWTGGCG